MDETAKSKHEDDPKVDESLLEQAKKKPEQHGSEKLSEDDELTKQGHD